MHLYSATLLYLENGLLTKLAQASALPEAEAQAYTPPAVAALVRQMAQPTDLDELNARWDMCRQLYLSQLLTNHEELLRTDLGWPDRRRYLAEKVLGTSQIQELGATTSQPNAAASLLGFLTILLLAVVGEHASQASLDPDALGQWLRQQPANLPATPTPTGNTPPAAKKQPAASAAKQPASAPAKVAPPAPAVRTGSKSKAVVLGLGCAVALGLGGYFALGKSDAAPEAVATTPAPAASVAEPAPPVAAAAVAAVPTPEAAAPAPEAPAAAPVVSKAAAPAGPVIRDTVGNAAMAKSIGGRFNPAEGRYIKGEGQPLIIKLVNRATLTVGINSTESLLYKRLASPTLTRPSDLVLDRLAFDNSRDRLGAEGAQQLGSVASLLKTFPKVRVLVLGHANPSEADATKLGLKRATAAVQELQKQGVDPNRLQAQGVLATGVPNDNDSPERLAMLQGISLKISRL